MTKKDYELVAKCLNLLVLSIPDMESDPTNIKFTVNQVVAKFIRELETTNPLFNGTRFLNAVNQQ